MKFFNIFLFNYIIIPCIHCGNILHISDIHVDTRYHVGAVDNCILGDTGLGCCRKYDIPKKPYGFANEWGNYNCDAPVKLVNETFRWIKENIEIDKIIYTGDSVDHHDIAQTIQHNFDEIDIIFELFNLYFPDKQLFHTFGNHDTYPIDQSVPYIYPKFLEKLNNINNHLKYQNSTILHGGYFYDYLNLNNNTKIKIISLNTMYYDSTNLFVKFYKNNGQWEWLEHELDKSKNNKEKVWILLHIPPSNGKTDSIFRNKFIYYLSKYKDIIDATFSGHIHNDNFKLYFNNKGELVNFGTIPSSLMPNHINPSFRIIEYDDINGKLLNYKQYTTNLTETIKNNKIDYYINYDFRETYNLNDFSKESFLQLYHSIRMNNTVLDQYYTYNIPDGIIKKCNNICKMELINNILIR